MILSSQHTLYNKKYLLDNSLRILMFNLRFNQYFRHFLEKDIFSSEKDIMIATI